MYIEAEQEYRLADGSKVVRKKGAALFRYGERVGVADVIFGEAGTPAAAHGPVTGHRPSLNPRAGPPAPLS